MVDKFPFINMKYNSGKKNSTLSRSKNFLKKLVIAFYFN